MGQEWINFNQNFPNKQKAFEDLSRNLFNRRFFDGKGLFHSNPNNPGCEVEPVFHEKYGRISFQSKYLETDKNMYSELKQSVDALLKEYSGKIDVLFVYCNRIISKRNAAFVKIREKLAENQIGIELCCADQILDEAFEYPRLYEKYFGQTNAEKLDQILQLLRGSNNVAFAHKEVDHEKPYVFINYSHKDREQVFAVLNLLQEKGLRFWCDLDLEYGENYLKRIQEAILGSKGIISFLSNNVNQSEWCLDEITYSLDKQIEPFIPFYMEPTELGEGLDIRLSRKHKFNYSGTDDTEAEIEKLLAELRKKIPDAFLSEEERGEASVSQSLDYNEMHKLISSSIPEKYRFTQHIRALEDFCKGECPLVSIEMDNFLAASGIRKTLIQILDDKIAAYDAEEFIDEYINAIRETNVLTFQEKMINAPFLLFDNLQYMAGRESGQQKLFYILKKRYEQSKPSVLIFYTDIAKLEEVIYDSLQSLLYENVISFRTPGNIQIQVNKNQISDEIIKFVADYSHESEERIKGTTRTAHVALARQACMYLIRKYTEFSFQEIGRLFGNRDATTVVWSINRIEKELAVNKELARLCEMVDKKLLNPMTR